MLNRRKLLCLAAIIYVAISTAQALGQPLHRDTAYTAQSITTAVVQVRAGSRMGSGVLIWKEREVGIVLTAAHVVEHDLQAQVIWNDQRGSPAKVLLADSHYDVAVLRVANPSDVAVVPIAGAGEWPSQGDTVRLLGFGGGRFRDWTARVNGYAETGTSGRNQTLSVDTQTIGGDSGGPILFNNRVVAIIWGGPLAGPRGPMLATHGTSSPAIRTLLQKVAPQTLTFSTQKQGCPPGAANCPIRPSFPPVVPRPRQPVPEPELAELQRQIASLRRELERLKARPATQPPTLDFDRLVETITEELATDPRFRGPPGKEGPPGRDGIDGENASLPDLDMLANQLKQRLAGSVRIRVQPLRR